MGCAGPLCPGAFPWGWSHLEASDRLPESEREAVCCGQQDPGQVSTLPCLVLTQAPTKAGPQAPSRPGLADRPPLLTQQSLAGPHVARASTLECRRPRRWPPRPQPLLLYTVLLRRFFCKCTEPLGPTLTIHSLQVCLLHLYVCFSVHVHMCVYQVGAFSSCFSCNWENSEIFLHQVEQAGCVPRTLPGTSTPLTL